MRIGLSLLLIAAGAIMTWAVSIHHTHGFNIHDAGIILMVVGGIGLVVTLIWMATRSHTDVVHQTPVGTSRTRYSSPSEPMDY
jgi:hypothetical protein